MANTNEIPSLVSELFEMSKSYLDQEAVAPLKRTGRYAAFSLGGGVLYAIGLLLLSFAALRFAGSLLPESDLYSVLAFVVTALVLIGVGALIMWRASKTGSIQ